MKPYNITVCLLKHSKKSWICTLKGLLYCFSRDLHLSQSDSLKALGVIEYRAISTLTHLQQDLFNSQLNRIVKGNTPSQLLFQS